MAPTLADVVSYTAAQAIVRLRTSPKLVSITPGGLRQLSRPPSATFSKAVRKLAQGCAAVVQELASLPVPDIHATGAANSGATCKNVKRTAVRTKNFVTIRVMQRPYDVASG